MYEELITALRETAETEQMEYGVDCYRTGEAANALESLVARLAALQAENAAKDKEIERVEAERDAAQKEIERMKDIMRQHGIMVIPSKHPGGRPEWNISRGAQGEG